MSEIAARVALEGTARNLLEEVMGSNGGLCCSEYVPCDSK